jgi:2'-5' RNA ligase
MQMPPNHTTIRGRPHQAPSMLAFGGFPPRDDEPLPFHYAPRPSDPVFFALFPSGDAAKQMAWLGRHFSDAYDFGGQPTEKERLHLSLLGPWPFERMTRRTVAAIDTAVRSIAMPPFVAGFDCAMNFGQTKGPLVLCGGDGVEGVIMFQQELATTMRRIGLRSRNAAFKPHVTLHYQPCDIAPRAVEEIRWTVRELVLICSLRGRHHHVVLGRWPLRTDRQPN